MAHHTRAQPSISGGGAPHAISLKVLRLSRPSFATQTPLPQTSFHNGLDIPVPSSLAYPGAEASPAFPLTPLLTLPAAFGAAYVGETFTCTLCSNCEVGDEGEGDGRSVNGVRIHAELQTPAEQQGLPLELKRAEGGDEGGYEEGWDMRPKQTVQFTLTHDLKEEGPHVLAVTVSYTETLRGGGGGASGGRARTFRKLYQFVAQPLIAVRSKVSELQRRAKPAPGEGRRWVLEAQLENVGETAVVLERLWLTENEGISGKSVDEEEMGEGRESVVLKPQDVEQVMFVLREEKAEEVGQGRVPLARVNIEWRSAMGEKGSLTTGWLASRPR